MVDYRRVPLVKLGLLLVSGTGKGRVTASNLPRCVGTFFPCAQVPCANMPALVASAGCW
jgi:hypothetical protein